MSIYYFHFLYFSFGFSYFFFMSLSVYYASTHRHSPFSPLNNREHSEQVCFDTPRHFGICIDASLGRQKLSTRIGIAWHLEPQALGTYLHKNGATNGTEKQHLNINRTEQVWNIVRRTREDRRVQRQIRSRDRRFARKEHCHLGRDLERSFGCDQSWKNYSRSNARHVKTGWESRS